MKSKEKKEWLWNKILELAGIAPSNLISIDLCDVVDIEANGGVPDNAPVIFSLKEQVSIIKKFEESDLIIFLSFDDDYRKAHFFLKDRGLVSNFEEEIKNKISDINIFSVKTIAGLLTVDKNTGFISLGNIKKELNFASQDFRILLTLIQNKNYTASYGELLNNKVTKDSKRNLGFDIRNIKQYLGILPKKKSKNKDIFQNIKGFGYKIRVSKDNL